MTAINELQGTLTDTRAGLGDARIGQQSRLQGGLGSVTKRRDRRRQPNFLMRASTTANTPNATDQLCPALLQATSAPKGQMWRQVAQRSDLIRRYACLLGPLFMIPGGGVRCVTGGSGRDGDSSVHALVDGLLIVPLENHE